MLITFAVIVSTSVKEDIKTKNCAAARKRDHPG